MSQPMTPPKNQTLTERAFLRLPTQLFYGFRNLFGRYHRYLITFLVLNVFIWSTTVVCVRLLPNEYVSKWTLILPGAGIGAKVDIDDIGSASSVVNSAFSSHSLSPKVNYKSIAQSSKVLRKAAKNLDISVEEFGKPRIKLTDQTALIYFHCADQEPTRAQAKSWALYEALQAQIDSLRLDEIARREQGVQAMLKTFGEKLHNTKSNLLEYQSKSDIVTLEQYNTIPLQIEAMRSQEISLRTEKEQVLKELMTLSNILGLTSSQASQVMSLQADAYFQTLTAEQSNAETALTEHLSKWADNHHQVKTQRAKINAVKSALHSRATELLGNSNMVNKVSLANHSKRDQLLYDLISKKTQYEGIKRKLADLQKQIVNYRSRLRNQSKNVSHLEELEREHQIAEAVFTSAVAKIDTGKSDIFASYPMLQMMMEPTLPRKMSGARPQHIYLGASIGSLMSLVILMALWLRRKHTVKEW